MLHSITTMPDSWIEWTVPRSSTGVTNGERFAVAVRGRHGDMLHRLTAAVQPGIRLLLQATATSFRAGPTPKGNERVRDNKSSEEETVRKERKK